jgi:hypothetical protein
VVLTAIALGAAFYLLKTYCTCYRILYAIFTKHGISKERKDGKRTWIVVDKKSKKVHFATWDELWEHEGNPEKIADNCSEGIC